MLKSNDLQDTQNSRGTESCRQPVACNAYQLNTNLLERNPVSAPQKSSQHTACYRSSTTPCADHSETHDQTSHSRLTPSSYSTSQRHSDGPAHHARQHTERQRAAARRQCTSSMCRETPTQLLLNLLRIAIAAVRLLVPTAARTQRIATLPHPQTNTLRHTAAHGDTPSDTTQTCLSLIPSTRDKCD